MTLTILNAGSDRIRFSNGIRATVATRAQLDRVLSRFRWFERQRVDGISVDESDVQALLSAMDGARADEPRRQDTGSRTEADAAAWERAMSDPDGVGVNGQWYDGVTLADLAREAQ